jgi:hypothetical protein
MEDFWADAEIISTYTRAQAIEDGVLVDVSERAREAGLKWPVAITAGVWATINDIPPKLKGIQDVEGRLWDVVWMARWAAGQGGDLIHYTLRMDRNENGRRVKNLRLKMVSGPGDDWEPVITIMHVNED